MKLLKPLKPLKPLIILVIFIINTYAAYASTFYLVCIDDELKLVIADNNEKFIYHDITLANQKDLKCSDFKNKELND